MENPIVINQIIYKRRYTLGEYQHEEFEVHAAMDAETEADNAMQYVKDLVHRNRTNGQPLGRPASPPTKEIAKKATTTVSNRHNAMALKEELVNAKAEPKEVKDETTKQAATDSMEETKPVKKAAKKTGKKTTKKTLKKKAKTSVYDRTNDAHKKRMGEVCNEHFGRTDWRLDRDVVGKVKAASQLLVGAEFLDEEGEVLDSFKQKFAKSVEA